MIMVYLKNKNQISDFRLGNSTVYFIRELLGRRGENMIRGGQGKGKGKGKRGEMG